MRQYIPAIVQSALDDGITQVDVDGAYVIIIRALPHHQSIDDDDYYWYPSCTQLITF